ncbi:uncharacterized protein F4812DRAFT_454018 [Daldinia caldariorum]|uniref:uncharacterized protein n=1 Tax=Daldinia caldariorum TaxID=326644 RepID=UPI0020086165|nr:uncharacterized protein F4812DRAFT_454018 [Daldinia caldariorum]KAI1472208.1 hypothetical protein F4812DRAFT_454018 [Daldinia caldariorum]
MPMLDADIDKAKHVFDINIWGVVRTIQAFADVFIANRSRIVNLNTCGAVIHTLWIAPNLASKAAAKSISDAMRLELALLGVAVVSITTGVVETSFHSNEPDFDRSAAVVALCRDRRGSSQDRRKARLNL